MRTTVNLDEELLARAAQLTGIDNRAALLRESLKSLIERESARRLAALGGTNPNLAETTRRRSRQQPDS